MTLNESASCEYYLSVFKHIPLRQYLLPHILKVTKTLLCVLTVGNDITSRLSCHNIHKDKSPCGILRLKSAFPSCLTLI